MSGRVVTGVFCAGVVLAAAGCAGTDGWRKAGASPAEAAEAVESCTRDTVVKVYGRESRVRYYRSRDVDPSCMQAKGFTRS